MASNPLPPVPHLIPVLGPDGRPSRTWSDWFQQVFQRIGGTTGTTASIVASDLAAHIADTVDAHDASAISNVPSGNLAATDVQGALNELQSDVDGRISSALTSAQILVGNASNVAAGVAMSGDATLDNVGAIALAATQVNIVTLSKSTGVAVHGSNTNDAASSGYVGEYMEGLQTSFTNATTSGHVSDLTSITITAGDWDVSLHASQTRNGATITRFLIFAGTVSGDNLTGYNEYSRGAEGVGANANTDYTLTIPAIRFSVSSSTTIYLKSRSDYTVATPQVLGRISARRVR